MRTFTATAAALAALALPAAAHAAPGDLDGTFSADGLEMFGEPTAGNAVAVAPDNSVVVAGPGQDLPGAELHGYAPGGGFKWGNSYSSITPTALETEPAGTLLFGGSTSGGYRNDFELVRVDPATGFQVDSLGFDGRVSSDFSAGDDKLTDVAAGADGSIAAAGMVAGPEGPHIGVARYAADGEPLAGFDTDGKWIAPEGGGFGVDVSIAVLADGSTVVAGAGPAPDGTGTGDVLVARLDPSGVLDTGFGGGDGWVTVDVAGRDDARSLAVLPDGGLVVGFEACAFGLHTSCDPAVTRLTEQGDLDPSFGAGGTVVGTSGFEVVNGGDGRVLVGGTSARFEYFLRDFSLTRLLPDGTPDPRFAGGEPRTIDFDLTEDITGALAVGPDGRAVVAGQVRGTGHGIARFEIADGPPDADADGVLDNVDRCPKRFARHRKTGCPSEARKLKLRETPRRFEAKIKAELQRCAARQKVRLVRMEGNRSRVVARDRTAGQGKAKLSFKPEPGRYRARVKQKVAPELARCRKAKSKVVRIRG